MLVTGCAWKRPQRRPRSWEDSPAPGPGRPARSFAVGEQGPVLASYGGISRERAPKSGESRRSPRGGGGKRRRAASAEGVGNQNSGRRPGPGQLAAQGSPRSRGVSGTHISASHGMLALSEPRRLNGSAWSISASVILHAPGRTGGPTTCARKSRWPRKSRKGPAGATPFLGDGANELFGPHVGAPGKLDHASSISSSRWRPRPSGRGLGPLAGVRVTRSYRAPRRARSPVHAAQSNFEANLAPLGRSRTRFTDAGR